jgi:uncharacterized protein YdhG (YjbR/CyaY superfamily)
MATKDPSREAHFPAIEKKYGEKMSYWFKVMGTVESKKYPEQIAHLRENYGFSQAHANALVMYSRGSTSARRYETPTQYFKSIDPTQAKTIKKMINVIRDKYPDLELVIAWNQPMLRKGSMYVFGASVSKNHISIAPWSTEVLDKFRPKLIEYRVTKKMIAVPNNWDVDVKLLQEMSKARLAEG